MAVGDITLPDPAAASEELRAAYQRITELEFLLRQAVAALAGTPTMLPRDTIVARISAALSTDVVVL